MTRIKWAQITVGACTTSLAVLVGCCTGLIAGNASDMSAFSNYGDDLRGDTALLAAVSVLLLARGITTMVLSMVGRETGRRMRSTTGV